MVDAFLEVVILKCPKCQNLIVEPAWFLDLESDIQCAACKVSFPSKGNESDRKMLQFELEKGKIKGVRIVYSLSSKK